MAPDGKWEWKDNDELEEAVRCGVFGIARARGRLEGERAIDGLAELPSGWATWLPDPEWPVEALRLSPGVRPG